jgi:serine/threonine-protein kinase
VREISDSSDSRLTAENVIHGTPQYLAPETIRNADSIDARSDLYSLGAVAYFLLTGTPVFSGRGALELIHHHLQTEPESLSKRLGKPIPPKLEAVVLSCLAKDPGPAARSARALADAPSTRATTYPPWDELEARRYCFEQAMQKERGEDGVEAVIRRSGIQT